ncbi:MAG: Ig-like domain-containing protein [Gemmatimonadaceae bacterium]|nr:Ig-like domain-containing protein [Gemmatimonadaceae bacterium]
MDRAENTDGRKGKVALRELTFAASLIALWGCASPGTPPGGPVDKTAPVLLSVVPDSARARVKPPAVIFHFDEVVSERPPSATSLDQLFLISPRDGTPSVDWHRKDVTVRPSKGWRANTTYVVTLLPGIADLRGNVRNKGAQTVFSTGASLNTASISGNIWNWVGGSAAPQAYIEAISLPDSVTYIAVADSTGAFRVSHVPAGQFLVRGVIDDNKNRGIDAREAWDSATVRVSDSASLDLYAIARDSIAPALGSVSVDDSVTLRLSFERALAPTALPTVADVSIQGSDSVRLKILSIAVPPADTALAKSGPPRPAPPQFLIVKVAAPLKSGADYRLTISRVTGIAGISAPAVKTFKAPAASSPPPAPGIK